MVSPNNGRVLRGCESVTESVIYFMLLFAPWAFGTTERWSMLVMNGCGYFLGVLLFAKMLLRPKLASSNPAERAGADWSVRFLSIITVALVGWVLCSALNASAVYSEADLQFEYINHIPWLPHSLDAKSTWREFWNYLALAVTFWAVWDWLVQKGAGENPRPGGPRTLPLRLRRLLWVLAINGALVAFEGLWQRIEGGGKLLWLVQPSVNPDARSQFGPYAYRANAAQFFNLIWPVTLGFWAVSHRHWRANPRKKPLHHLLLSCVMIMAACPLISDSRAGAVVTVASMFGAFILLLGALRTEHWTLRATLGLFAIGTLALGLNVGWKNLRTRMFTLEGDYQLREQMYETARQMAADYRWLGTGPGTFDSLFQLYRKSPDEYWPAQLHNDWLESRITFGMIGFGLSLGALVLAALHWTAGNGIVTSWVLPAFTWLSLAGCLVHARVDFPFQIYSILFIFLIHCSVLLSIARPPSTGKR